MFGINLDEGGIFTVGVVYGLMILAALWLAMIIWTYRDMRARSRDTMAQLLVSVMVAVLTLPGLFIYLLLRPRETLAEAYERSLEEEALLQEIEEKPACPGCGQRVQANWQACPNCHTRLKKSCISCRQLLELSWNLCPHCAASQGGQLANDPITFDYARAATPQPEQRVSVRRRDSAPRPQPPTESLEFVDTDEF